MNVNALSLDKKVNLALSSKDSDILEELLLDKNNINLRCWVARHPNTPPKTLELLATDKNWSVRYWVAENPNTPKYVKQFNRYNNYLRSL